MDFKDRLKELRKAKGLSQVTLAERLGLSKSTIGAYETGDITPSVDALNLIADFFNVDMNFLLGKEDQSRFFMDYDLYNIASELSEDSELLAVWIWHRFPQNLVTQISLRPSTSTPTY
ncbi:MAG: helix-turn-helix transcriptional regulator [Acutalibacteraceae bacterium]|nr:helix-turn-helix transcriptional regulator [Acutalibacteraceae bacterium]